MPRPETRLDLEQAVRLMVDEPDRVRIKESWKGRSCRFELEVAPKDRGKVIGRQGRTAHALRTLLETRGEHEGVEYTLEIAGD